MNLFNKLTGQGGAAGGGGAGDLVALLGGGGSAPLMGPLIGMLSGGGLAKLLGNMKFLGFAQHADSWVGNGPNQSITPDQAKQIVGDTQVQQLASQSGLSADQVSSQLSTMLPNLVNHVTPNGSVPSSDELESTLGGLMKGLGN